jgi:hypothetical protein
VSEYDPELGDVENICNAVYALARAVDGIGLNKSDSSCAPGALEFIGMQLRDNIGPSLQAIAEKGDE